MRHVQNHSPESLHAKRVWGSIVRAKGFPSFPEWWKSCPFSAPGTPHRIPILPPARVVAQCIFDSMCGALREFEGELQASSRLYAKLKRETNPNAIFQDLRSFHPNGVDVLLQPSHAQVIEVRPEDLSVVLDKPIEIDAQLPVVCRNRALPVIHAEHDCIWLESIDQIGVGSTVTQVSQVGTPDALSKLFLNTWKEMWERHSDVPPDRWRTILDFARRYLPRQQMEWSSLDAAELHHCICHKKSTTSGGLDGVTLADLKAMPGAALQNFTSMYAQAEATGDWPSQVVAGRVSCIPKTSHPEKVLDFRPITVLGLLCRCWSTHHARHAIRGLESILPVGLFGSRPRRFAGQLWSQVLWAVEHAYESAISLCGIIVDLQKAFNFLPRDVIFESCALVGIPFAVLRGWAGALSTMARRFMLNGSLTLPAYSNCGLPEGCALSCLGMMVVDILFHQWMTKFFPLCQPLSYVDDWQVLLSHPEHVLPTFRCLEEFTQAMDLLLDQKKTHSWSVCPRGRQVLRAQGLDLIAHGKNLGAHVQFSRQHTNCVLMERIADVAPLWQKLRLSACGYAQKTRALRSAAWPRCLHGIAATTLSSSTFESLRSGAMRGLRADGAGANPMVHLGLIETVSHDPLCWAILQTCRFVRDCGPQERVEQVMADIVQGISATPANSITHTLCSRLQVLGWHIDELGHVHDVLGSFSLFGVSAPELQYRVEMQWPKVVAAATAHRRCFQGLEMCSPSDTRQWLRTLDTADQALFRKVLNGSHITQDGKTHCDETATDVCPFCMCSDSRYHRFWECVQFDSLRAHICPETLASLRDLPETLTCSGWSLQPSTAWEWDSYFAQLLPPPLPHVSFQGDVHLFTDGSCHDQHVAAKRFAGWSVVEASCEGVHDFSGSRIVDSGVLPGLLQSAVRAEIFAILRALELVQSHNGKVYLWTDCDSVVKKVRRIIAGGHINVNGLHADLWARIRNCIVSRSGPTVITRVAAHQSTDDAPNVFAEWCFRNNGLADRQAVRANATRSEGFWNLWIRHCVALDGITSLNRVAQNLLLRISQEVVRHDAPMQIEMPAVQDLSLPFRLWVAPPVIQIPSAAVRWYGDSVVRRIASWFWQNVWQSEHQLVWVSHFQLYADYMLSSGHPGPIHIGRWLDGTQVSLLELRGFAFKQRTRWFIKVLKEVLRHQGFTPQMAYGRPRSHMVLLHTGIIALPWCPFALGKC